VPEFDFSKLPIVEIALALSLIVLVVVVFVLRRHANQPARARQSRPTPRRVSTPESVTEQQGGLTSARRLEQDLSFLVDFIKEFPTLMTQLNNQAEVRQIPLVILNALVRIFRAEQAVVLVRRKGTLMEPERSSRLIVAALASSERGLEVGAEIPIGHGQLGMVAETQRVMDRQDFARMAERNQSGFDNWREPDFEVAAPMVHGEETLGVVAISRPQRHHPSQKEMMQMIAHLGAISWHNLTAYRHVKVAADVDELTGIYNKRALKFRLSELVYEARQNGSRVGVYLFDIDHFKNYNDLNGHIAGDQALRLLGQLVRDTVRADDIFGRFGGEEFLLIMPGRTPAQAMSAAGNIRQRIARYDFPFGDKQPLGRVTVSGGVATFPDDAQDAVELLLAADSALYRAKQAGRNKVLRAETGLNPIPSTPTSVDLDDSQA
jgi:diguanylate cyclase (GGDEF)-like protein